MFVKNNEMKDLEKQIEISAKIHAGFHPEKGIDYDERYYNGHKCDQYDSFISGAKSEAAKEYWLSNVPIETIVALVSTILMPNGIESSRGFIIDNANELKDWTEKIKYETK